MPSRNYTKTDADGFVSVGHKQSKLSYHSRHTTKSPSYDEEENDDSPVLFPCQVCKGRLPTKNLNGMAVKKYDDNTCAHCWTARDILDNPEKYGFTERVSRFIGVLDDYEVPIVLMYPNHTLYADLVSGLYHWCGFEDPEEDRKNLIKFLNPIKAYNLPLLIRLNKLIQKTVSSSSPTHVVGDRPPR